MALSLSVGFLVSYPVNVLLVSRGVKGGMQDPTDRRSFFADTGKNDTQ